MLQTLHCSSVRFLNFLTPIWCTVFAIHLHTYCVFMHPTARPDWWAGAYCSQPDRSFRHSFVCHIHIPLVRPDQTCHMQTKSSLADLSATSVTWFWCDVEEEQPDVYGRYKLLDCSNSREKKSISDTFLMLNDFSVFCETLQWNTSFNNFCRLYVHP